MLILGKTKFGVYENSLYYVYLKIHIYICVIVEFKMENGIQLCTVAM